MTDDKKPNIDPSKDTVIGLKGAEQHHDLKNQTGDKGDPDHADDNGTVKDEEE